MNRISSEKVTTLIGVKERLDKHQYSVITKTLSKVEVAWTSLI